MGTVNVNLGEATQLNLLLGQQLENEVTEVVFDFSDWETDYGSGTLSLSVQRHGDDLPYPAELTVSGTDATWSITDLDTAYKGVGEIQLTYTVGTVIKKSVVYKFTVYRSLGENGEYPSPGQTWQQGIEAEISDINQHLSEYENIFTADVGESVSNWLDVHPEATTTVEDGSITKAKFADTVVKDINSDGSKLIWAIQTNVGEDSSFYGLSASNDGLGHTLVEGFSNFLDVENRNLGTDWIHFQHDDYHVFTITYSTSYTDCYVAITKDFINWVHAPASLGFKEASAYSEPYVWTPQIFEYKNKLYIGATVQEQPPLANGSRYSTLTRYSAIYVIEIELDYDTATITPKQGATFQRITFEDLEDYSGDTHVLSDFAMDAWFVPTDDKIYCVVNDRYMLEIHSAVASEIDDTFTILHKNIYKTQGIEAPTVLQISENLWQVSACLYDTTILGEEANICCYTSDFTYFYNYEFMKRIDVATTNGSYTRRMRNPSFFYMTDEQEHEFCKNHNVKTNGYQHTFKPVSVNMGYYVYNLIRYTDVALPPSIDFLVDSTGITLATPHLSSIYGGKSILRIRNATGANRNISYKAINYRLLDKETLVIDVDKNTVDLEGYSEIYTGADVITLASSYSGLTITNLKARKINGIVYLDGEIGNLQMSQGSATIGQLELRFRPRASSAVNAVGFVGAGTAIGTLIRIRINDAGNVVFYSGSNLNSTLRFSAIYEGIING